MLHETNTLKKNNFFGSYSTRFSSLRASWLAMMMVVAVSSVVSGAAFAEVQVVDYSIDSKGTAVKEIKPAFVPVSAPVVSSNAIDSPKSVMVAKEPEAVFVSPPAINSTKGLSMDQRITKLENQVENNNRQNFVGKIDELQARVQKLTGQLEDQTHQIEQLNSQMRNLLQDVNQRLEKNNPEKPVQNKPAVENKPAADKPKAAINDIVVGEVVEAMPTNTSDTVAVAAPNQDTPPKTDKDFLKEQQMYQTAIDLLPGKHYETSSLKLIGYLKTYPKGAYVAKAHYWLGEISFLKKNYDAAEESFKMVVDKYAKSNRAPDAMFKLALVHQYQGREAQAKRELKKVMQRYPGTSAASLAKAQLEGN